MDHSLVAKGLEQCAQSLSAVWLFVTPGTEARQAPPSMGSSRQESWRRLPFPPPGIFPTQGSTPCFVSPALAGGFFTTEPAGKPCEGTHVTQWNYGHAVQSHARQTGHGEEFWKLVVHWRMKWQPTPVFFFIPIPKKGNAKECSNCHITTLITR